MSLSIISVNARGLRNAIKRKAFFLYCRQYNTDFCFIQESHSVELDGSFWRSQWGGDLWFAHGTERSGGVGILKNRFNDCSQAQSCDQCVGDLFVNMTSCVWRLCPNGSDTGTCMTDQGDAADSGTGCSWTRISELCPHCAQAQSCDLCVGDPVLNPTGCVWRLCPNGNDTGVCVTDKGDVADSSNDCSWTRDSGLCPLVETVAVVGVDKGESGDGQKPPPQLSQAKFSMPSFIGGIVLVLIVQAGVLIAMRFLKSKEKTNYDPIE
ncbi:sialomucin core protein 24 isoform X5 [Acanthochromis polyacanthus]|uniref:sialomucin core protein 24 isoform X5 n=1 Tax=Acanthochromis polyacanthus TaxID=80966 RepID=UPI002233F463|nr:sialomucin core protein 24 isoform X5 [Acanthochromis polyacanthus]